MISDLAYDTELMDIKIEEGDFVVNTSLSEQNGALILNTKNVNLYNPLLGVGIGDVINGDISTLQQYLGRWQSQVLQDGGKSAVWTPSQTTEGNLIFTTECAYE
jgi:hypothetical protein